MAVLSDEQTLVTGSFDHTLEVWDTLSSKNVGTLLGHADRVWCCVALANDWVVSGKFRLHVAGLGRRAGAVSVYLEGASGPRVVCGGVE